MDTRLKGKHMNSTLIVRSTACIAAFATAGRACADATPQSAFGGATAGASELLLSLPVYVWGPLLMLVAGCVLWLVALVLIQPTEQFPRRQPRAAAPRPLRAVPR